MAEIPPPASPTPPPPPPPELAAGLRFAVGTLTVLPVRVVRWDRPTARLGMLCAPLVGLLAGLLAAGTTGAVRALDGGPLLAAVLAVAVGALLTRGLHLDGLADTADGLGVGTGRSREAALEVMRRSDIGPFGVLTLLLVPLTQVAAVARIHERQGWALGAVALAVYGLTSRAALTLGCRQGVPAARAEGLGSAVADLLPRRAVGGVALTVVALAAGAGGALGGAGFGIAVGAVGPAAAVLIGLAAAELLLRHCHRRLGGVTGDVLGALAETAGTAALLALALGLGLAR